MLKKIENLKIESVISKKTKAYGEIADRKTDTFNIRTSGTVEYEINGKKITVNKGEMIFLPKGSTYKYRILSEEESFCIIINMQGDFEKNEAEKYAFEDLHCAEFFLNNFVGLWNFGDMGEKCKCMSNLYDLISIVSNYKKTGCTEKNKIEILTPAINYLKKHICNPSLKTGELHKLCGISNTYFRRIFILEFGMSPKNYITEKRILHAKSIIDSGEFDTVKQLSLSVGFTDALYFGKVFKNYYGVSPKKMNEM